MSNNAREDTLTKHVTWSGIDAEKVLVVQGIRQPHQQPSTTLDSGQRILLRMLHTLGQLLNGNLLQPLSIDLAWLRWVAAEKARLEHLQASNGQPFAARVDLAGLLGLVGPPGAGSSVEQHGHDEQIDQAAGAFLGVNLAGPRLEKLVDPGPPTHVEMLPTAMWRDVLIVWCMVSL